MLLNKPIHPKLKILLYLLFLVLFFVLLGSLIELFFNNQYYEDGFSRNRSITLVIVVICSSLSSMFLIYLYAKDRVLKKTVKLNEKSPLLHLSYNKQHWLTFKTKEFLRKGFFYLLKLSLIWIPIALFLVYLLNNDSWRVATIFLIFTVIIVIPLIPFTLGSFIIDLKNQLFSSQYKVNIYTKGITVNGIYHPFNYYVDLNNALNLVDIKKMNLHNIDCLKFISKRKKSYNYIEGPDLVLTSTKSLVIPLPKNHSIDIKQLKKQTINTFSSF